MHLSWLTNEHKDQPAQAGSRKWIPTDGSEPDSQNCIPLSKFLGGLLGCKPDRNMKGKVSLQMLHFCGILSGK